MEIVDTKCSCGFSLEQLLIEIVKEKFGFDGQKREGGKLKGISTFPEIFLNLDD